MKIIVPFRSVPSRRVRQNFKKIAKNFKNLKSTTRASFQAKIGWKRPRKRENKNFGFFQFLPNALQKKPKKIAKKLKKFKSTIMASFQAKIGWKRTRKRENKNYRSDHFLSDPLQIIPKK